MGKNKVCYFYDNDTSKFYYGHDHPMKPQRVVMAHHLIMGYGLHEQMDVYRPRKLDRNDFLTFHSEEFIDFLAQLDGIEEELEYDEHSAKFGINHDTPAFPGVYQWCRIYAGATVNAARKLNNGQYEIAINWSGGLHHGKRAQASGFCYANDLVLGIQELLRQHARVLYIDIDIHHGDGVEEAFYLTDRVMTLSFHKYGDMFFPETGALTDIGEHLGRGYAVNVPLKDGMTNDQFHSMYKPILSKIMEVYDPGAIVLQCGADSLADDWIGCFNLTVKGHAECVKFTAAFGKPLLVTGGGGYTKANVARCWANETAMLLKQDIDPKLPQTLYSGHFAKDHTLRLNDIDSYRHNANNAKSLEEVRDAVLRNLDILKGAPAPSFSMLPPWAYIQKKMIERGINTYGDDQDATQERILQYFRDHEYIRDPTKEEPALCGTRRG